MDRRSRPDVAKKTVTKIFRTNADLICTVAIYVLCGALCWWQIGSSLCQYRDQSVVSRVSVVHMKTFVRPSFTMCTHLPTEGVSSFLRKRCASSASCQNYVDHPLTELNLTTEDIWKLHVKLNLKCNLQLLKTPCAFAVNVTRCTAKDGITADFNNNFTTIFGNCVALYQTEEVYYSADSNSVLAVLGRDDLKNMLFGTAAIVLHADKFISKHNVVYTAKRYKLKREIQFTVISIVEFNYLNLSESPCVSEEEAIKNYDRCVDEAMRDFLPCGLPFIDGHRSRPCVTFANFLSAYDRSKMFYRMRSERCRLQKRCRETVYRFAESEMWANYLIISITVPQNLKIIISEIYAYSLSQFLSESVGNVGFFLNFTLVNCIEALQFFINAVRRKIIFHNGKFSTRRNIRAAAKRSFVDRNRHRLIYWGFFGISIVVCFLQVIAFTDNFLNQGVRTRVSLVKMKTIRFPFVTVCPTSFVTNYFKSFVSKVCADRGKKCESLPFHRLNGSLEDFIRAVEVRPEDLNPGTIPCKYAVNESRCLQNRVNKNSVTMDVATNRVPTVGGQCTLLYMSLFYYKKKKERENMHTYIKPHDFNLSDDEYNVVRATAIWSIEIVKRIRLLNTPLRKFNTTMLTVALHQNPLRFGYSYYLRSNEFVVFSNRSYNCKALIVSINEIHLLRTNENPCVDEREALKRYNRCMNKKIKSILPCRIFDVVSKKLRECDSLSEFWRAYTIRRKWILHQVDRDCVVERQCEQTVYTFFIEQVPTATDEATLSVEFVTDRKEITTQNKSYGLSSLFTDISNSLAFYLGFSLMIFLTRSAQLLFKCHDQNCAYRTTVIAS